MTLGSQRERLLLPPTVDQLVKLHDVGFTPAKIEVVHLAVDVPTLQPDDADGAALVPPTLGTVYTSAADVLALAFDGRRRTVPASRR